MPTRKKPIGYWIDPFLEEFSKSGNVRRSCEVAEVHRSTVYERYDRDKDFAAKFDDAADQATDILELEARRRAIIGTDRVKAIRTGTDENGRPIYERIVEREYSDVLLIFLMKGLRPEKYRDNYPLKDHVAAIAESPSSSAYVDNPGREGATGEA